MSTMNCSVKAIYTIGDILERDLLEYARIPAHLQIDTRQLQ